MKHIFAIYFFVKLLFMGVIVKEQLKYTTSIHFVDENSITNKRMFYI